MSLLSHIATLLARGAFKTRAHGGTIQPAPRPVQVQVVDDLLIGIPVEITAEDVTPPFEAECSPASPKPDPAPPSEQCAHPGCTNPAASFWCSDQHYQYFLRDLYKPGPSTEAA